MKRTGLLLILIIIMGILPIQAQTELELTEPYTVNLITYYPESQGYDVVKRPDETTWIYSQRYHVEALDGTKWKQVGVPYKLTLENQIVTRHYTDYLGTEIQVSTDTETRKTDITVNSGESRKYRIVWTLDGVTNTDYTVSETLVNFTSGTDWIAADWSDAQVQGTPTVSDSANGKKLEVIFNIGPVASGVIYTLDPSIIDSYGTGNQNSDFDLRDFPGAAVSYTSIGCTFTTGTTPVYLYSVELYLKKTANPTADIQVQIYTLDPTLTVGVNATPATPIFDSIANSTVVNSAALGAGYALVPFNFTNTLLLNASTSYGLLLLGISGTGNLDLVNQVNAGADSTPAGDDNTFFTNDAGLTWKLNNWDLIYYVYGTYTPSALDIVSDGTLTRNQWDWLNATVMDLGGANDITNATIQFYHKGDPSYNYTVQWIRATDTYTLTDDPRGMITFTSGNTVAVNATTRRLELNITQTSGLSGLYNADITLWNIWNRNTTTTFTDVYTFSYYNWIDAVYDFINSAFTMFGVTNFMSDFVTYVSDVATYFTDSLTSIVELIVLQFRVIPNGFTWIMRWLTRFVTRIVAMFSIIVQILNGTYPGLGTLVNFWDVINLVGWTDVIVLLGIFLWMESIESRSHTQNVYYVIIGDLQTVMNILGWFMQMFSTVVNIVIDGVFRLFSAIL